MIELRELHKRFGRYHVLRGLTLTIPKNKITVIIGPSGSGKSVTLKHIIGLLQPDRGNVLVDGVAVGTLNSWELAKFRRNFGMVFQHAALFDSMTVFENVAFPLHEAGGYTDVQIRTRVTERLAAVGLSGNDEKMPADLSGGMRKRVGVARALALQPSIVLYDEPTTGLDPLMTDAIDKLIVAMQHERPVTSVVISHDIQSTFRIADFIAMLHGGCIIETGTPQTFRQSSNPIVRRFLEGRSDARPGEAPIDETIMM